GWAALPALLLLEWGCWSRAAARCSPTGAPCCSPTPPSWWRRSSWRCSPLCARRAPASLALPHSVAQSLQLRLLLRRELRLPAGALARRRLGAVGGEPRCFEAARHGVLGGVVVERNRCVAHRRRAHGRRRPTPERELRRQVGAPGERRDRKSTR